MGAYRTYQSTPVSAGGLAPTFLLQPAGVVVEGSLGDMKDALADRAKLAAQCDLPLVAPTDALPKIGLERGLPRGPGESDASYAARLATAWSTWPYAGTPRGLLTALSVAGYPNVVLVQQLGGMYRLDQGSTNQLPSSSDMSATSYWPTQTGVTMTHNFAAAFDGTATSDRLVYSGAGAAGGIRLKYTGTTPAAGLAATFAIYLKATSGTPTVRIGLGLTGAQTSCVLSSSWQRFSVTQTTDGVTALTPAISSNTADNSALDIQCWGPQLEALGVTSPGPLMQTAFGNTYFSVGAGNVNLLGSPRWHYDPQSPPASPTVWTPLTPVVSPALIVPSPANGYYYQAVGSFTTGSSSPVWLTGVGSTTTDGAGRWICRGVDFWSRFSLIFVSPFPASWGGTPPIYASNEVSAIRNLVNTWRPAHSTCVSMLALSVGKVLGYPLRFLGGGAFGTIGGNVSTVWSPV